MYRIIGENGKSKQLFISMATNWHKIHRAPKYWVSITMEHCLCNEWFNLYSVKKLSNRNINTHINIMDRSYLRLLLWASLTIATVLARSTQQVFFQNASWDIEGMLKNKRWTQITTKNCFRALPACDLPTAPDPTRFAPSLENATVGQERCSLQVAKLLLVLPPLISTTILPCSG